MAQRSLDKRIAYQALKGLAQLGAVLLLGVRCRGRERLPRRGPVLVCANHQSYLDPVVIGLAAPRRLNFVARQSLFRPASVGRFLSYLDAIPIDREGSGLGGLKETLRRLRRGEAVLIFPEGTRTRDGRVGPFEPGVLAVVRRSRAWLAPVGGDGMFDAWPRHRRWPRPAQVAVVFGDPLSPEEAAAMDDQRLLGELERRVRRCWEEARRRRAARRGLWLP